RQPAFAHRFRGAGRTPRARRGRLGAGQLRTRPAARGTGGPRVRDTGAQACKKPQAAAGREGMSTPGRPKGSYRSAQHEGTPVSMDAPASPMQRSLAAMGLPTEEFADMAGPL